MYSTLEGAKKSAKSLHRLFDESGFIYPLSKCQLAIAKAGGFQHWHDLESNLTTARQPAAAEAYRRRLIAALPESCRNPVRAWFADEPPPDPPIEGYPARWYRDVYPYLAAVTKLHRRTPLLRPGSGRGQQLRELLVYELLLNLKGGAQPPPRLEADTLAFCFRGDLEALYPEQIRHPDFERELARLVEAKILDWRFGMMRVLPPAGDVEAEVRERKAGMAQYWTETSGEAGDHERLMALREALAAIGVNHALRIAGAIAEQGSDAYTTPSGAMLDLLSRLAAEGELETFARAVDLAAKIHPQNAAFVRGKAPAKIASNYFGARLKLPLQDFTAWTNENPDWPDRLIDDLSSPDLFRRTVDTMAEQVRGRAAA
ncbi:MAG: hypothetical protein JHD15_20275 [Phenylobacterium sp.]|uniref:hypothetical protein n=1 Tax=Phenylobacterium sp. TaxID=1871053 RepID=UPI001A194410|nr:hypothetical protein [Phenylobacterium sp.]MBJ7412676.1 hypothetical protein [Phenylobacterium sp.]